MWANERTLREIEAAGGLALKNQVNSGLGGQYFCGPRFRPDKPACPDFQLKIKKPGIPPTVRDAYERNRTSRILVTTKANEIAQRAKEAQAIRKLRRERDVVGPSRRHAEARHSIQANVATLAALLRLVDADESIERIAGFRLRLGDEAVVGREGDGREQTAVELKLAAQPVCAPAGRGERSIASAREARSRRSRLLLFDDSGTLGRARQAAARFSSWVKATAKDGRASRSDLGS